MPVLAGITYQELPGSGRLRYSPDGIVGQRIFLVEWADRIEFCRQLLGYAEATGHIAIRTAAQRFPGFDYLYCYSAVSEGLGELGQGLELPTYSRVKVTAEYRPLRFGTSVTETDEYEDDIEDARRHLNESYEFSAMFLNVPGGFFKYSDDPGLWADRPAIPSPPGILVGTLDLMLESEYEPEIDMATIQTCLGKVNSALWYGYGAGKVLFLGASARRTMTSEGIPAWTVLYRFRARTQKWNWFFKGESGIGANHADGWWEIENVNGDPPYQTANFSALV